MAIPSENIPVSYPKPGSFFKAVAICVGIGVLTICYGVFPILFAHGRIEDIKHSGIFIPGFGLPLFMLIMICGLTGMQRRSTAGQSPWNVYFGMLGAWLALGALAILVLGGSHYRLAKDLAAHGLPAQARIVRSFSSKCSKYGCSTEMEYSFSAQGRSALVAGFADEGNISRYKTKEYDSILSTGYLSILYDPSDPTRSLSNFGNKVREESSAGFFAGSVKFSSIFLLVAVCFMGVLLWPIANGLSKTTTAE